MGNKGFTSSKSSKGLAGLFTLLIGLGQIPYAQAVESIPSIGNIDSAKIISEAENLIKNDSSVKATKLFEEKLKSLDGSPAELLSKAEILSSFAAWASTENRYDDAISYLNRLIEVLNQMGNKYIPAKAMAHNRIGDCLYHRGDTEKALEEYLTALEIAKPVLPAGDPIMNELLDNITGCLISEKKYKDAESYCWQLIDSYHAAPKQADFSNYISESWAYLTLSDIYRKLSDETRAQDAFVKWARLVKSIMQMKLFSRIVNNSQSDDTSKNTTASEVSSASPSPSPSSEDFWSAVEAEDQDLPIMVWKDPNNFNNDKIVVCVHGLGLNSNSYADFAKALVQKGFIVIAMDVRGFGAWANAKGEESVDFKSSLIDFKWLLKALRQGFPASKIFLLGESMGGALALQATAEYPDLIDGLISSVPASERYKRRKTDLKVALHFIRGPKKSFDIGTGIINQATQKPSLRHKWHNDPKDRLDLTPVELIKFDMFMNENLKRAAEIKDKPVLVVQGSRDKLVKPESTIKLFDALACEDRNLLIIGKAEHLIFEEGQFNQLLVDAVTNWMNFHSAKAKN